MKLLAMSFALASLTTLAFAKDDVITPRQRKTMMQTTDMNAVSPALEKYNAGMLQGDLFKRRDLSPRDRSIVTLAIIVTRNQPAELRTQLNRALDNGVKPREISEMITHLAFYSGWGNATAAVAVAKDVFGERKIGPDQLPPATPTLLPLEPVGEANRAARVKESAGPVSDGLVKFTGDLLFRNLWLRPDLAPRDRSLVTVSSLIASGQFAQITFHLNKAMDNGLTKAEAGEVITQAAFYAGWPNAFSAVPIFGAVFEGRPK